MHMGPTRQASRPAVFVWLKHSTALDGNEVLEGSRKHAHLDLLLLPPSPGTAVTPVLIIPFSD